MGANSTDVLTQVLLRVLPSIVLFALAFIAGSDRRTCEQWAQLLYQIGSIRPDQREDPKIQRGVRTPFFILATLLLVWPIYHYFYITKPIEVTSNLYKGGPVANNADLGSRAISNAVTNGAGTPNSTPGSTSSGSTLYGTPSGTPGGTPATSAQPTPRGRTNIYGTPMP